MRDQLPSHSKDEVKSSMTPSRSFSHRITVTVPVTADGTQIYYKGVHWHVLKGYLHPHE